MKVATLAGVYDIPFDPASIARAVTQLLVRPNMRARVPCILAAGVYYQREEVGGERWQTVPEVAERGAGDCEDLAAWLVAYDLQRGVKSRICALQRGPSLLHIVVARPIAAPRDEMDEWQRPTVDGLYRIVDPSRALGM
jgi:hypothetical protein